jgi:hypothetical protein
MYNDDDIKDSLGTYMSENIMNETDFRNLRVCWSDFVTGVSMADQMKIRDNENKREWDMLLNHFMAVKGEKGGLQEEHITESMAESLHKCMAIACVHHLVRQIEEACPGWPWLLMEVDKQVAKRKGSQYEWGVEQVGGYVDAKMGRTDVRMLLEQLNPGNI